MTVQAINAAKKLMRQIQEKLELLLVNCHLSITEKERDTSNLILLSHHRTVGGL